ncbi:MAG TPA: hypothetical protein VM759_12900, partial [Longimicrobium sp.]|nr:hypothetical protein [Longimicrobium sp.]
SRRMHHLQRMRSPAGRATTKQVWCADSNGITGEDASMITESKHGLVSPGRLLEMLTDRFGAFEALAMASIKLARHVSEGELSMDLYVAEAVLEFGDDLRQASQAVLEWTE